MATVNNALVTWTDLSTMNLPAKGVPETGQRIATKQFIVDNYVVNTTASPFAGYTANRCPPYQTILPGVVCGMTGTATYNSLPNPASLSGVPTNAVAVSRDTGQYQLIGGAKLSTATKGYLYTSSDYGLNWYTNSLILGYWQTVAISGNGRYMLAVEYYGNAYRSSDYGTTWTQINNLPGPSGATALQILNFRGTSISSTGQYQAITTKEIKYSNNLYYAFTFISSDYGATWTIRQNFQNEDTAVNCVSISSTGQYMYVGTGNIVVPTGYIYRSTNYGVDWTSAAVNPSGNYNDISISADNVQGIATVYNSSNYTYLQRSTNNGVTWININQAGGSASAADSWYRCVMVTYAGTGYWAYAVVNYNNYIKSIASTTVLNLTQTTNSRTFTSISASADGQYFLASFTNGTARSSNKGADWSLLI